MLPQSFSSMKHWLIYKIFCYLTSVSHTHMIYPLLKLHKHFSGLWKLLFLLILFLSLFFSFFLVSFLDRVNSERKQTHSQCQLRHEHMLLLRRRKKTKIELEKKRKRKRESNNKYRHIYRNIQQKKVLTMTTRFVWIKIKDWIIGVV